MSCCGHNTGIAQTIVNGVVGLSKVLARVDIDTPENIQKRRDICRHCNHSSKNTNLRFISTNGLTNRSMCSKCHCLIVAKTQLTTEKCPLDLWQ